MKSRFRLLLVVGTLTLGLLPFGAAAASYQYEDLTQNISQPTQVHYTSTQQPPSDDDGKTVKN